MQKIRYSEAKVWFWTRTWFWFVPVAIVSGIMWYFLPEQVFSATLIKSPRVLTWFSIMAGIATALLGLLAAFVSLQTPWMRFGWRRAFLINGLACAILAVVAAGLVAAVVVSAMRDNPKSIPSPEMVTVMFSLAQFGVGVAAFWGFVFGTWFAVRRDKYFVEPI